MKRAAILLMLVVLAAGNVLAAPPRGFGPRGGLPPGRGFNPGQRPDLREPNGGQRPPIGRPSDAEPGGRRLSPEDREQLRRDIRENGRQIYRGRPSQER
jgi:hypothetical protein